MKAIFVHIFRKKIGFNKRPSFIFESCLGTTFFERALKALGGIKQFDAVFWVCPSCDKDFFNSLLASEKNKQGSLEWTVLGLGDDHPGAFTPRNIRFDPLKWIQQDAFGLWNYDGWEALTASLGVSQMLLFNLESFWYLDSIHYDELALMLDKGDFVLNGDSPEDFVMGIDVKQLRFRKTRFELQRKKQIQNRIHNFSTDPFGSPLPQNDSLKTQMEVLSRLQKEPLLLKDFVSTEESSGLFPLINAFSRKIQNTLPCISLREINGLRRLKKVETDLNLFERAQGMMLSEKVYSKGPRSFKMEGDLSLFSEEEFQEFIQIWKDVPYFRYIEEKQASFPSARIKALKDEIDGIIWLESSFSGRTTKDLEDIYLSGITGFVLKADFELEHGDQVLLEKKMNLFRALKQDHPEIFFLVQIHNRQDFQKKISAFIHRYQYAVDGIFLTGEGLPNAYHTRDFQRRCTRVPYELVLHREKSVSLCCRAQKEFSALRRDQWFKESAYAGQRTECTDCPICLDFGISCSYYSFCPETYPVLKNEFLRHSSFRAERYIKEKKYEEALHCLENILKNNPLHPEAWAFIEDIRKKIIE